MRIKVLADVINLDKVIGRIRDYLLGIGADEDVVGRVEIAVEELFVNVCSYSYNGEEGNVMIEAFSDEDEGCLYIRFTDSGVEFNPFAENDIDVDAKAVDDSIGGLGIYMVKNMMDETRYERTNDQNVVVLKKNFCVK